MSQLDVDIELARGDETVCAGPFGVLRLGRGREDDTQAARDCENASMTPGWEDFVLEDFSVDKAFSGLEVGFLDSPNDDRGIYDNLVDLSLLSPMLEGGAAGFVMTPMPPYIPREAEMQLLIPPSSPATQIQRFLSVDYAADLTDVDVPLIRLLLARYQDKMIPTFAPVQALRKSLWERLHIPRVHQTLGEILVRGDSGDPECALLFAVLSAASYHLDAVGGGPPHHSMTPWKDMARIFRQRAKARLESSLETVGLARSKEAYENMLLAVLSMVTVCVVSGDMAESHAYLRNVEQLIESSRSPQLLRSTSVRMLHSTFLYLWTLQAKVRVFGAPSQKPQTQLVPNQPLGSMNPTTHSDVWEQLIPLVDEAEDDEDNTSPSSQGTVSIFEQVYSVSESLFRLIGRATSLASEVGNHEATFEGPLHRSKEVSELEEAICSWRNDCFAREPQSGTEALAGTGGDVRYHFQNAIHSALLIHFYRCVRVIDTHVVQPHVEKTILHLQLYTQAKRQSGDQSSGTCWPGFVAACESLDQDLRQRFSSWFLDETAQTGIRMFATADVAVKQVWDARDRSNNRNLPWSEILRKDNILDQLMLS